MGRLFNKLILFQTEYLYWVY